MKRLLDVRLGRVGMYTLVMGVLFALLAVTLIFSVLSPDLISFDPLVLLGSAAAAVLTCLVAGRVFGLLFRVRPQDGSAIITGLLLFFILQPSLEPAGLGGIVLAGAVATASKYALAVRGRHIFNPAAFGAFFVTVTAIDPSIWWVATTPLLPFVAIGAFLILYRTRRLGIGGWFILVSLVIVTIRLLLFGQDVGGAVGTALASYPIIFIAGFMLSEPLTLPPRRWQQFVVATIAAVLFAIPFNLFEVLFSSPELALLVANLVAFGFGQRRRIRLSLVGQRRPTPGTVELTFQPSAPVRYHAGQYLEVTVPHGPADRRGSRRVFSLVSAPSAAHPTDAPTPVAIAFSLPEPASSLKRALVSLEPGQRISATGVWGDFLLPADPAAPLLLVAAGIGVTPFVSQLTEAQRRGEKRDVVLVYAVSDVEALAYLPELEASGARVFISAPEAPDTLPTGWKYIGAGRIDGDRLREHVPDLTERTTLISGPPGLVDALKPALRQAGVRRVHSDYFSGY
ncbi:FAD-dependent oxidoreductase [Okibacterium fritillariae]|uniref:FAD-dependent oxidoreductase n=1 Tax=Okibacterium fritillariae TaxID=123320 RepID=UPI0040554466